MAVSKILRSSLYVVDGLIALALLTIAVLAFLRIPIDLSSHKGLVLSTASFALGRTVKVDDTESSSPLPYDPRLSWRDCGSRTQRVLHQEIS